MQEPYREGPTSHPGPESCAAGRKARREALTGENAGQVTGSEITIKSGVPTPLPQAEGNIGRGAIGESRPDPAESKTLCMRGHSSHGNREAPRTPAGVGADGTAGEGPRPTPGVNGRGESDSRVVPEKQPNKGGPSVPSAEAVEGRRLAKGNSQQAAAPRTQSRTGASSGLLGVREVARRDRRARFTALLHHVTPTLLRMSFYDLKRHAAAGVDGVTWQEYEVGLEERLRDLHGRVHQAHGRNAPESARGASCASTFLAQGAGRVAEVCCTRLRQLPCRARKRRVRAGVSTGGHPSLAARLAAAQPEGSDLVGALQPDRQALDTLCEDPASVSQRSVSRQNPRQEPYAVVPLVRIRGGGPGQPGSLLRPRRFLRRKSRFQPPGSGRRPPTGPSAVVRSPGGGSRRRNGGNPSPSRASSVALPFPPFALPPRTLCPGIGSGATRAMTADICLHVWPLQKAAGPRLHQLGGEVDRPQQSR